MHLKEVADLYRVPVRTMYRYVRLGRLRAFRVGRKLLVREEDLREWEEDQSAVREPRRGGGDDADSGSRRKPPGDDPA